MPARGDGDVRRHRTAVAAALAAVVAISLGIVAIVAYGGEADEPGTSDFEVAEGVEPLGEVRAGSVASLVDCADWSGGSVERKQATVVDIREQLTSGGTIEGRPSLSDQEAYEVFDRACAEEFTSAFRLYKVYYQANAFANVDPYEYSEGIEPEPDSAP